MRTLLTILTYVGILISSASVVWGLLNKTYTEDEYGKRRLTKAGKYSLALIGLGLAVSLNTAALKDIIANQDREAAKSARQAETARQALVMAQQTNAIVRDIRRGQYPISSNIGVTAFQRISLSDSALLLFADRIAAEGRRLLALPLQSKAGME